MGFDLFVLPIAMICRMIDFALKNFAERGRRGSRWRVPIISFLRRGRRNRSDRFDLRDPLKLRQIFLPMV